MVGGALYFGGMDTINEIKDKLSAAATKPDDKNKLLQSLTLDERFNPKNLDVSATDRLIFIALSYVIRSIALFVVEWAVMTQFTNDFKEAFFLYFGIYFILFGIIVGIVNFTDSVSIKALFYFIDGKDQTIGWIRIAVHVLVQLLLLPIPFIVGDKADNYLAELSFSQRRSIIKSIENFTLFVWGFLAILTVVF